MLQAWYSNDVVIYLTGGASGDLDMSLSEMALMRDTLTPKNRTAGLNLCVLFRFSHLQPQQSRAGEFARDWAKVSPRQSRDKS